MMAILRVKIPLVSKNAITAARTHVANARGVEAGAARYGGESFPQAAVHGMTTMVQTGRDALLRFSTEAAPWTRRFQNGVGAAAMVVAANPAIALARHYGQHDNSALHFAVGLPIAVLFLAMLGGGSSGRSSNRSQWAEGQFSRSYDELKALFEEAGGSITDAAMLQKTYEFWRLQVQLKNDLAGLGPRHPRFKKTSEEYRQITVTQIGRYLAALNLARPRAIRTAANVPWLNDSLIVFNAMDRQLGSSSGEWSNLPEIVRGYNALLTDAISWLDGELRQVQTPAGKERFRNENRALIAHLYEFSQTNYQLVSTMEATEVYGRAKALLQRIEL